MSSVHAVLRNRSILQVIIHFVKDDSSWEDGRRDLFTVALVCHAISDLALDVLWRDISLSEVHSLFPLDIVRVNSGGTKELIRIPATSQEWERFDIYASRVRELLASPRSDLFLHGVRMRYPIHHPFPNLTRIQCDITPLEVMDVMPLICPTMTEAQFTIHPGLNEYEDDDAVADLLESLGETCSRLRKFEYTHFSTTKNCSKAVEASLIYLIRQCRCLEDVHLPVSRDLLRDLASLPHLSTLRLEHVTWEAGSQLYLPIEAYEGIEEADGFPVLDDLTIAYSHTVSYLTECFQGSGCFPRKSFTMRHLSECEQWSTSAIAEFFRGILRPDRFEGLQAFWISRETDLQNPVGHDPWQALRFLSSIPNLRTLLLHGLFLDINDMDLIEISRIWPEMRFLQLSLPRAEEYQPQISFHGLAHLSTLENLETLSLTLAPESTISESMLSLSMLSQSPLNTLIIRGTFPPVTPFVATLFLILHFPRLEYIVFWDNQEDQRMKEIQVLLDGVRPRMNDLFSECRSLISGIEVEQEGGDHED